MPRGVVRFADELELAMHISAVRMGGMTPSISAFYYYFDLLLLHTILYYIILYILLLTRSRPPDAVHLMPSTQRRRAWSTARCSWFALIGVVLVLFLRCFPRIGAGFVVFSLISLLLRCFPRIGAGFVVLALCSPTLLNWFQDSSLGRPFACSKCERSFQVRAALVAHERHHE